MPKLSAMLAALSLPAIAVGLAVATSGAAESPGTTAAPQPVPSAASADVRYDRDIRPLLADRCFRCHGPDAGSREADLRLDLPGPATASREGGAAIVPGDATRSLVWQRISHEDPAERMPPRRGNRKPLNPEEQELVRRWIEAGAAYEPHWSFTPPIRPALPEVRDAAWCRTPIDRFVLAALERRGIAPSPPADPATLGRRLFFDLTGLPPTPEELEAFVAERAADWENTALRDWSTRLMGVAPYDARHAERMAAPWLDAARYADTCGIHMDAGRQMWLWRDWVLEAFRSNMPFDRFLREQLAGDLLPDATEAQRIASGFNRNHVTSDEGGAIAEEYLVEYAVDRASTTGSVFLGLTLGCARCHDHKFDPVSQEEFFGFYAYFNSIEEPGLYSQTPDANRAHEPELVVPTAGQRSARAELVAEVARTMEAIEREAPEAAALRAAFMRDTPGRLGGRWSAGSATQVVDARSSDGAVLTVQPDGSVLASGPTPPVDEHSIFLSTDDTGLRTLLVEALPDPSLPGGRPGRAANGNAVVTGIEAEAISILDPTRRVPIRFAWAWADIEQQDGDFRAVNVLDPQDLNGGRGDDRGWAIAAHQRPGGRVLLLLADQPFGFEGGSEIVVRLRYRSPYEQHALGRVRLTLGALGDVGADELPEALGGWHVVGPFPADSGAAAYDARFGPEEGDRLDAGRNFGAGNQYWRPDPALADERLNRLATGTNVTYVGRQIFAPNARWLDVSLGSDDGFRLFVNGAEVLGRKVERSLAADQDRVTIALRPGMNWVVLKVVNAGGDSGFSWRSSATTDGTGTLRGELVAALLPTERLPNDLEARRDQAWKVGFLPSYRAARARIATLDRELAALDAAAPRTMVMRERPMPRETFVLNRGQYDQPDRARPVRRGVPAALGALPESAPANRLGLAEWMTAPDNPLVARVAVNRLWEQFFGTGLVATSEDFGHQGEWPSHPELLDWLAVELRESCWDMRHIIELIVTSATYGQSSRGRPELRDSDPDNRLLASFPRRRLTAEEIRDQALYCAGLLVERLGGPSVKSYQPDGLWQEVAMPGSNTRVFERGMGDDLWRRTLYTYWKRALPPPSLMAFDAPTRESCTIRRASTNTPLQALVLWNDEQMVEASRALAARTLAAAQADEATDADAARLSRLFARCTGRSPEPKERDALLAALTDLRARYQAAPADAAALVAIGESAAGADLDPAELAAWTLVANAILSTHEAITRR